jgi:hypothetical protein
MYKYGGQQTVQVNIKVQPGQAWNQAPREATPAARTESRTWTQDGVLLDRILIIPGVPSGEPLFRQLSSSQALPVFESSMLPNEIEELTESSIVKLFGEGGVVVETTNLRPHRYGDKRGILFDLEVTVSDGPDYKGVPVHWLSPKSFTSFSSLVPNPTITKSTWMKPW